MEHKRSREENFDLSVGQIAPKNIRFDALFESLRFFFRNCLLNLRVRGLFLMGLDLGSIDRDARGKRGVIFRNVYVFFKI